MSALDAAASAALSRSADAVKRSKQMTDSVWNTANKFVYFTIVVTTLLTDLFPG